MNFPVEVKTDIEVIATTGDYVQSLENAYNLTSRTITVWLSDGTCINMLANNKLNSVTVGGGNASQNGGNVTLTYSYSNWNDFVIVAPQDPSGLTNITG